MADSKDSASKPADTPAPAPKAPAPKADPKPEEDAPVLVPVNPADLSVEDQAKKRIL